MLDLFLKIVIECIPLVSRSSNVYSNFKILLNCWAILVLDLLGPSAFLDNCNRMHTPNFKILLDCQSLLGHTCVGSESAGPSALLNNCWAGIDLFAKFFGPCVGALFANYLKHWS